MAGEDNIKLALRHLDKAVFEKSAHIKDRLSDFERQRKDLEREIERLNKNIAGNVALAANGEKSEARRAAAAKAVSTFKSEIEELKQQVNRLHDDIKNEVKTEELLIVAINDDIAEIQRML